MYICMNDDHDAENIIYIHLSFLHDRQHTGMKGYFGMDRRRIQIVTFLGRIQVKRMKKQNG